MSVIVYQTDKRSVITYAYRLMSHLDKEKQQSRAKRTLIGRVDPDTYKQILSIAYFLIKSQMSPLKLKKIVYFAYGYVAAFMNNDNKKEKVALFSKPMEAWVHGPVVAELYNCYSKYSGGKIPKVKKSDVVISSVTGLILNIVWDKYKSMNAKELV